MSPKKAPLYILLLLILAGEAVFILPFVLARVFRPTVLEVFGLDNLQLGLCFSVYGVVAMFSYLLGGPLADRFLPRKLIAIALWLTASGGLLYAAFPNLLVLQILYAYWGFTTIFLFWAPMIKATRMWGGAASQGKAFGFLDGGRGLVGAILGSIGVLVFSMLMSKEGVINLHDTRIAFRVVIYVSSAIVALVGVLVWFFLKLEHYSESDARIDKINMSQIGEVMRLPSVWLLMLIILCAYVGYKVTDIFSLYASDVMLFDQLESARVGTFLLYVRPLVGVLVGLLADRSRTTLWLTIGFVIAFAGAMLYVSGIVTHSATLLFAFSTLIVASGVYAVRCLYFAVMEKGKIPLHLTGTSVGLVSLVGYTPDVFAGPLIGYLLELSPGVTGHQHVFVVLAAFALIGFGASWFYAHKYR
ncbi:MAG: MFS transporter [Bacteroidales bacterium]|nr:MFS transporter [Bacteroidales bacterium]